MDSLEIAKIQGEERMNCCDEFGNCTQGRDCPIRRQRYLSNKQIYIRIAVALLIFWHAVIFLMYWGLT